MSYNAFPNQGTGGYMPLVPPVQQSQSTIMVEVDGEEGAMRYPVAANNTVLLKDRNADVVYLKSTDANGYPFPMRTFDFKERVARPSGDYVTRKEFEEIHPLLSDVKSLLAELSAPSDGKKGTK